MSETRFEKLRRLFDVAETMDAVERGAFLDRECAHDPQLRTEVESLLDTRERIGGFLESEATPWRSQKIGAYTVDEVIAEGGMGIVLRATQEQPRRPVAIKLIRGPGFSSGSLQRFELEAEVLGRLDHPGIAAIYEAGMAERDGSRLPYFVMELIEGEPLVRFAKTRGLSVRERVALMIDVAEAVHHAHLRGVIHRDLKPSNILVREDGQPKILDFGVARVTDTEAQLTQATSPGQILGTLPYMSPEQVSGRSDQLDLRSDVYTLGVLLYELLTGRLPHSHKDRDLVESARIIVQDDPAPLSGDGRRVPADLETIVQKSLRKEPSRRYESADKFAQDLQRFLDEQPITARPTTMTYQLRKFARRNRGLVALGLATLASLVAGLAVSITGWSAASRATDRAEVAADEANTLSDFLAELLAAPDPHVEGRDVRVVDLLDRAASRADDSLSERPEVAVRVHQVLGDTYRGLGLESAAEREWRLALRRAESLQSEDRHLHLAESLNNLGDLMVDHGRVDSADSFLTPLDAVLPRVPADSPQHALAALTWGGLADVRGEFEAAKAVLEPALEDARAAFGPEHTVTIDLQSALGNVLWQAGEPQRARELLETSLEVVTRQSGPDHPVVLSFMNNLASVYGELEEHVEARDMLQRILAVKQRVQGEWHASTGIGHHNLAHTLRVLGQAAEAIPHHEKAIAIADSVMTDGDIRIHIFESGYGRSLIELERYADARDVLESCYPPLGEAFGADHGRVLAVAGQLVEICEKLRDTQGVALWQERAGQAP